MNATTSTLFGTFIAIAGAWLGLLFVPYTDDATKRPVHPFGGTQAARPVQGEPEKGRAVYLANGCNQCHSQHVRRGADVRRGWGARASLPGDFTFDHPGVIGEARTGPDLTNVGDRRTDPHWHYRHLFAPRAVSPDSVMPSFRHLFATRKVVGQRSNDVIMMNDGQGNSIPWNFDGVPGRHKPKRGEQILLTDEARALVAYLLSLDRDTAVEFIERDEQFTQPTDN